MAEERKGLCGDEAEQLEDGFREVVPRCTEEDRSFRGTIFGHNAGENLRIRWMKHLVRVSGAHKNSP